MEEVTILKNKVLLSKLQEGQLLKKLPAVQVGHVYVKESHIRQLASITRDRRLPELAIKNEEIQTL